jgi:hypothetical protein
MKNHCTLLRMLVGLVRVEGHHPRQEAQGAQRKETQRGPRAQKQVSILFY